MGKNKPADLGIGNFMDSVKENNVKAKSLENETVQDDLVDITTEISEEAAEKKQMMVNDERGAGRPKKKVVINRNVPKPVKFDEEFCQQLALIKAIHKIDHQDFIYVATLLFRNEFFPKGKATKEGLDIINDVLKQINGK